MNNLQRGCGRTAQVGRYLKGLTAGSAARFPGLASLASPGTV